MADQRNRKPTQNSPKTTQTKTTLPETNKTQTTLFPTGTSAHNTSGAINTINPQTSTAAVIPQWSEQNHLLNAQRRAFIVSNRRLKRYIGNHVRTHNSPLTNNDLFPP
jgi:hypothetical protein